MTALRFRLALAGALLFRAPDAFSQSLGLSSTLSALGASPNACASGNRYAALATEAIADWALARVAWSGAVASSFSGSAEQSSTFRAALVSPAWRGLRAEASLVRDVGDLRCTESSHAQERAAGVSLGWQQSGVSLRYVTRLYRRTSGGPFGGSPSDTLAERVWGPAARGLTLAAWHNVGRTLLALSVASRSRWSEQREQVQRPVSGVDTVPSDSGPIVIPRSGNRYETRWRRSTLHALDAELRLAWARSRLSFDLLAGRALGSNRDALGQFWGRTETSLAITPAVALVGGVVFDNGNESRELAPRRYATLGLRLTSLPFARPADEAASTPRAIALGFRMQNAAEGSVTLGIRAPHARLVELTGDFVQWRPVRMQRVSVDWWEVRLPVSRGVHRVNVRIDGGRWNAPPGLSHERDEFGGDAGVLVVP